ncbi:thiamine-phosphate synthase family protein [Halovenus salina]|uniref:thiamine-phosphate synthase family protein n=1 Tax=Halovenus salina TaxID=1510225 RepID=UPI002260E3DB|nr:thiamine-phosphate synthase family protein [Halovenus salina]
MKFIEELVVEEFLPTFRSMLAEALRERGRTQNEVAELLGISQSAVSKYVHGEVERNDRLLEDSQVTDLVERLADGLTDGEMTPAEALVEAEVCIRQLERGGTLTDLHTEAVPALAGEGHVDIHDPDSRLREAGQVRASVRRGLRVVQNTEGFAGLIPAVGSNLAESLSTTETIEDVAAVPGRIIDVHGRVTIPGEPEFGVSQHVANILLAARDNGSDHRAALNVSYDEDLLAALEEGGAVTAEFDAEASVEPAIAAALAKTPDADVLYQTGGFGIEPILYVLGADAPTVATTVRDIAGSG